MADDLRLTGGGGAMSAAENKRLMIAAANAESEWTADALPFLAHIGGGQSPRPVALMVMAGDVVIHTSVIGRLRGGAQHVADAIEKAVMDASVIAGALPARLRVRHEEVAGALAVSLHPRDIAVSAGATPALDNAARSFLTELAGTAMWPPIGRSDEWLGWDLPRPLVASLFAAAARFYRAAPWTELENLQAPTVTLPSGRAWVSCVMGNAGEEYGVVLYSEPRDLFDMTAADALDTALASVTGRVISLSFSTLAEAGADAVREARMHRWEFAGPSAFPTLLTINTPGGGVSYDDILDLIAIFDAMPAFTTAHGAALRREAESLEPLAVSWSHTPTGALFTYKGELVEYGGFADTMPDSPVGVPTGLSMRMEDRVPDKLLRSLDILADARTLLGYALEHNGLALTGSGSLKLNVVAAMIERLRLSPRERAMIADLVRPREEHVPRLHFLRVIGQYAGLLSETATKFHTTYDVPRLLDDAHAYELYRSLFAGWMNQHHTTSQSQHEWPELTAQLPFTLSVLRGFSSEWLDAETLYEHAVLAFARDEAPFSTMMGSLGPTIFTVRVLEPLVAFGLLDVKPGRSPFDEEYRGTALLRGFLAFDIDT